MVGGILRDQDRAGHGSRAIGMSLERRVPETLREMMLARRKTHIRGSRVYSERQRKCEPDRRAVRPISLAREIKPPKAANPRRVECARIVGGVRAVEEQHREAFTRGEK